ncbi:MAG: dUTP diphosphatase [Patescibacteria group bacterium]
MKLFVKKLLPEAKIPSRAHHDDAGLDLFSAKEYSLLPGQREAISTGIALAIPTGFVGLIWDKSGIAAKTGVKSMGGVIDAQYRGEITVIATNLGSEVYVVEKGAKIAQLLIQKVELPEICETEELDDTLRSENGFGSTGSF